MGSNMAENHPVGFQWPMEARRRGAKLIHVDPRYTRTSAMCNLHVVLNYPLLPFPDESELRALTSTPRG